MIYQRAVKREVIDVYLGDPVVELQRFSTIDESPVGVQIIMSSDLSARPTDLPGETW